MGMNTGLIRPDQGGEFGFPSDNLETQVIVIFRSEEEWKDDIK